MSHPRTGHGAVPRLVVVALLASSAVGAQVLGPSPAPEGVQALAVLVTCPPKPPAEPCELLTCKSGEWVSTYKSAGTACDDGDPCTYGGRCPGSYGSCEGTPVTCVARGPCETAACNGTSSCTFTARAAGTACGYPKDSPGDPSNPCGNACDGSSYLCQP